MCVTAVEVKVLNKDYPFPVLTMPEWDVDVSTWAFRSCVSKFNIASNTDPSRHLDPGFVG